MMWKLYSLTIIGLCSAATIVNRRTRQLDLSPVAQPQPQHSTFQQSGYLPPLNNEIAPAGAQNDITILRPTETPIGPTHHGRDLCTDPFHSFLCATLKPRRVFTGARTGTNLIEGANSFNVPSKVLAPPLNDLEEIPSTTTQKPTSTTLRPTTTTRRPTTTTPRPTTTTRRPTTTTRRPTTTTRRPNPTTTIPLDPIVGPAASSDVRTYLPPDNIAPAAASNDLAVVAPEEHEHHHHPHHHGRDLCTDPFHSFLCQPLKPRKRISGDLPNYLQGQSSFESPQKVKPEPEVKPAPSNNVDLAYLPPSTTRRPVITTTTIRTTPFRRISPQPSNDVNRIYLPPVTTTRRPPTTTFQPQPSNLVQNSYLPPVLPQPTNINNNYLPPVQTTRRPSPPPTTRRPPPSTTTYQPQPSNLVQNNYLPPSLPEPTNVNNNYLPPDPKIEPAAAQNDPAIVAPDQDHHHDHHHGSHGFKDICSDPFHSFLCTVPKTRTRITGALPNHLKNLISPAPSNIDETRIKPSKPTTTEKIPVPQPDTLVPVKVKPNGYDYPKPENQFPLPSENKPSKTGGYQYPKPDVRLTLPSEIKINVVPTTRRPTTTTTPRPTTTTPRPTTTRKPTTLQVAASNDVRGYDYPKPEVPFPPKKGYDYPRPDVKLTLPSEIKINVVSTTTPRPTTTTRRPTTTTPRPTTTRKPTTLQVAASNDVKGYDYPKPEVPFPPKKGYDYPKPDVKLTLPSEIKPVGYEYPKPSQPLPETTNGYNYPKPSSRFGLPSEQTKKVAAVVKLPGSIQEARERLQELQGNKVEKISNISNQNNYSDLITVNHVEFNGGFGERLQRRVRKHYSLVPPPGSHPL